MTTRDEREGLTAEDPDVFLQHLTRGGELLAAGQNEEALGDLESALALSPGHEKAQNLLGLCCFKLGHLDRAAEIYEQLVRENPVDSTLRVNLGLVYLKANAVQRAVREFETATELVPEHRKAHNYLGLALAQASEFGRAREHFLLAGSEHMAEKMARALDGAGFEPVTTPTGGVAAVSRPGEADLAPSAGPGFTPAPELGVVPTPGAVDVSPPGDPGSEPHPTGPAWGVSELPASEEDWGAETGWDDGTREAPQSEVAWGGNSAWSQGDAQAEGWSQQQGDAQAEGWAQQQGDAQAEGWAQQQGDAGTQGWSQQQGDAQAEGWPQEQGADGWADAYAPEGHWAHPGAETQGGADAYAAEPHWAHPDSDAQAGVYVAEVPGDHPAYDANAGWMSPEGDAAGSGAYDPEGGAESQTDPEVAVEARPSFEENAADQSAWALPEDEAEVQVTFEDAEPVGSALEADVAWGAQHAMDAGDLTEPVGETGAPEARSALDDLPLEGDDVAPEASETSAGPDASAAPEAAVPSAPGEKVASLRPARLEDSWGAQFGLEEAEAQAEELVVELNASDVEELDALELDPGEEASPAPAVPERHAVTPAPGSDTPGDRVIGGSREVERSARPDGKRPEALEGADLPRESWEPRAGALKTGPGWLAGLARQLELRVSPSTEGFTELGDGVVELKLRDGMRTRTHGYFALEGQVLLTPEPRRIRGRAAGQLFGPSGRELMRVQGSGHLLVRVPGRQLLPLELGEEGLFAREAAVYAFEESVMFENGSLSDPEGNEALRLVHLKGSGRVLVELEGALRTVQIREGSPARIELSRLVGWFGDLEVRAASAATGLAAHVELSGQGFALLDAAHREARP